MLKNKYSRILSVIIFAFSASSPVSAELKMGIVNLDTLFKEIPIYRESQEKVKKQFDPRARNLKTLEQEWNTLNDEYLKNELKKQFKITLSRRTVTKYRLSLEIPSSKERKGAKVT